MTVLRTKTKIALNIAAILLLFAMLAATVAALFTGTIAVRNNLFAAGNVKIVLNNGQRIFDGSDINKEPGNEIEKPLTIQNLSSGDVWYRIYLTNVSGALKDALVFRIYDGTTLVKTVTAADFGETNPLISEEPLAPDAIKTYRVVADFNECAGNAYENQDIHFDMTAVAVQSKNNPDRDFG